jgi:hypothetical protein
VQKCQEVQSAKRSKGPKGSTLFNLFTKMWVTHWRRPCFQDSKDSSSTANLKHHTVCCFCKNAVNATIAGKEPPTGFIDNSVKIVMHESLPDLSIPLPSTMDYTIRSRLLSPRCITRSSIFILPFVLIYGCCHSWTYHCTTHSSKLKMLYGQPSCSSSTSLLFFFVLCLLWVLI